MNINMLTALFSTWESTPDKLFYDSDDRQLTAPQFLTLVENRASAIAEFVSKGDTIIVQAGRGVEFFIDLAATWALGGVVIPLAEDATVEYCSHVCALSDAMVALTNQNIAQCECIPFAEEEVPGPPTTYKPIQVDEDAIGAMLFTSGSTGQPKGVMLTYASILNNSRGFLDVVGLRNERILINIPYNFTSGICYFLACCLSGSTLIACEKKLYFADLYSMVQQRRATVFGGAPIQLRWIAETVKGLKEAGKDFTSSMAYVVSSGDHLAVDTIDMLQQGLPELKVFTMYGLTELGGRFCILHSDNCKEQRGSVGKPIPGLSIAIHDIDTGGKLPAGKHGEVIASGSLLCKGYSKNPEATAKLLTDYGLRTADLGYLNEEGYLYLTGRLDDVFKVNGQKVSAVLIAEALLALDLFKDVGVQPVDLPFLGISPVAACVMKDGVKLDKSDIMSRLRKTLPANHVPQHFLEVDAIPRTGSGKVQRTSLKALITESLKR